MLKTTSTINPEEKKRRIGRWKDEESRAWGGCLDKDPHRPVTCFLRRKYPSRIVSIFFLECTIRMNEHAIRTDLLRLRSGFAMLDSYHTQSLHQRGCERSSAD